MSVSKKSILRDVKNYVGMAYNFGGFDDIKTYKKKYKSGAQIGKHFDNRNQQIDHSVAGIDCSGLVSRVWKLNRKFSTSSLIRISYPIHWSQLQTGDILNKIKDHTIIFIKWIDKKNGIFKSFEAVPNIGVVTYVRNVHNLPSFNSETPAKYEARRYKYMGNHSTQ